jgi:hypothetical protein
MWGALEKAVGDDMVPDNSHDDMVGRRREDVEHVCDLIDRSAGRDEGEDCGAGAWGRWKKLWVTTWFLTIATTIWLGDTARTWSTCVI